VGRSCLRSRRPGVAVTVDAAKSTTMQQFAVVIP
jgi:hypothetical protein